MKMRLTAAAGQMLATSALSSSMSAWVARYAGPEIRLSCPAISEPSYNPSINLGATVVIRAPPPVNGSGNAA